MSRMTQALRQLDQQRNASIAPPHSGASPESRNADSKVRSNTGSKLPGPPSDSKLPEPSEELPVTAGNELPVETAEVLPLTLVLPPLSDDLLITPVEARLLVALDSLEAASSSLLDVERCSAPLEQLSAELPVFQQPLARHRAPAFEQSLEQYLRLDTANRYRDLAQKICTDLAGANHFSLLVATAEPDPDLPETVVALGIALQRRVDRLLLVDADDRQMLLTRRWQLAKHPGLLEVLQNKARWQDSVLAVLEETLHILPLGHGHNMPGPCQAEVENLLQQWKQHYDVVLVSGDCGESELTRALACQCDASYLLVRLGTSTHAMARRVADQLQACGARLYGCIITNAN